MSFHIPTKTVHFQIPESAAGKRLDAALADVFPGLGLRGRRRLWEHCRILLDGCECSPAHRLSGGATLVLEPLPGAIAPDPEACGVRLAAWTQEFVALFKPTGLHSAALAGGANASLEGLLPDLWRMFRAERPGLPVEPPRLLTRLDAPTAGLVVGAFEPEAAARFRRQERAGEVDKYYLALVEGEVAAPLVTAKGLDTAGRKKTLLLPEDDIDPARQTRVFPLHLVSGQPTAGCLVRVQIKRGARHQIRAHLAGLGHPLRGDTLYGGGGEPGEFLLCHYRLEMPGFVASLEDE